MAAELLFAIGLVAAHQPLLRRLLRESREGGLIQREEQQLSEAALVFGDRRAREVMTPRSQIDAAPTCARSRGRSRASPSRPA